MNSQRQKNIKSTNPRPLRGMPAEFKIVSESITLNLRSIPNPAQRETSYRLTFGTIRKENQQQQATQSLKAISRAVPSSNSLNKVFLQKFAKVFQAFKPAKNAKGSNVLRKSWTQTHCHRPRGRSREGRSLKPCGSRCRACSPRISTNVIAYGLMAQKTELDASKPFPRLCELVAFVEEAAKPMFISNPSLYFSDYEQPDLHFCYTLEHEYIKSYQAHTMNRLLVNTFRVTPRSIKATAWHEIWELGWEKEEIVSNAQNTAPEARQRYLDHQQHSLVDLDDSDTISKFDNARSVCSSTSKRKRSNSVPESSQEWKRFSSYTSVLRRMGAQWIKQLNTEISPDSDIGSDESNRMDGFLDAISLGEDSLLVFKTQQQDPVEKADSLHPMGDGFLLHDDSGTNSGSADTDGGVSTTRSDEDALLSTSVIPNDTPELPISTSAVNKTFLTTKKQISNHIHEILSRLRKADTWQKEEKPEVETPSRSTLACSESGISVATITPDLFTKTTKDLEDIPEKDLSVMGVKDPFLEFDDGFSVNGHTNT